MEGRSDAMERELFWKLQKKSEECRNLNLQIAKMDKGAAKANAEIDRLTAHIAELTQCDPFWYGMSVADAFRMWAEDREKMKRMRQVLEQIAIFQGVDSYGHVEIARKALKEAE